MRNVADTGLQILYTMLQNVAQEEAAAQSFYQTYFCDILQHIFSVVTDTSHTAGEFYGRHVGTPRTTDINMLDDRMEVCVV
ncbi:exportin-1-like, partial [Seriola lalandi dorsalis]|uniref:exportin-1-like n=1 Tax=Seriola lalandi dorsalis TaxID=1841481 RepID=UPI000C6F9E90